MITVICLNSVSGQMLLPSLLPDIVAVFSHPGLLLGVSVKNLSSNLSKNAVNNLKLRVSYGSLGNTVGGNYDWQALYKKVNNVFDERVQNGLIQSSIQNLALSWEKSDHL